MLLVCGMLPLRSILSVVVLGLAWPALASTGEPDGGISGVLTVPGEPCRVRSATDSPRGLMKRFQQSYECGDLGNYAQLFTLDFRFTSDDPRFVEDHPNGLDRDEEIEVAR